MFSLAFDFTKICVITSMHTDSGVIALTSGESQDIYHYSIHAGIAQVTTQTMQLTYKSTTPDILVLDRSTGKKEVSVKFLPALASLKVPQSGT